MSRLPEDIDRETNRPSLTTNERRDRFLALAFGFEGSLALVALALGWVAGIQPMERFVLTGLAALVGIALAFPPLAVLVLLYRFPFPPFRGILRVLDETIGPELALCRWWELLVLAVITGFGEELLFRGVFHPWIGLVWSNLVFGLVHWVTWAYAVYAGLIGFLLGMELDHTSSLIAPMLTHAVYDFAAFLLIARRSRKSAAPL